MEERQIHVVIPVKHYSQALKVYLQVELQFGAAEKSAQTVCWHKVTTEETAFQVSALLKLNFGNALAEAASIGESFKTPEAEVSKDTTAHDNLQQMIRGIQTSDSVQTFGYLGRRDASCIAEALSIIRDEFSNVWKELERLKK